ncbi:MAG: DNA polymerase III subunit delta [Firmicutes bacterium]|nr:DNA polymerase III subunit delta [Bacillota bacterium]
MRKAKQTGYTYQDLILDIKRDHLASIYLFAGEEDLLVAEGIAALKRTLLPGDEGGWNLAEFDAQEASCEEVVTFLSTLPVFGAKRVAVVGDAHRWTAAETEGLLPLLEDMPDYAHLIMVVQSIDKRTKFYRTISRHGKVVEVPRLNPSAAAAWVLKRGRELDLELSRKVAQSLVDQVGLSLWQLENELRKLACYKDEHDLKVTEQDIERIAITGRDVADNAIFRFTDAVAEGKTQLAVELLEELLASGREPLSILAMIARQFRIIAFAGEATRQGMNQTEIGRELGVPGFAVQRAAVQGQYMGSDGTRAALWVISQADRAIKSGFHPANRALELLVIRLTEVLPRSID